jgi:prepilin-type N-terminal cleavage/methylation domain-containing protein
MRKNGFTFIELIVSISVLAILVAIVIFAVNPFVQFQKGRDARRKADLNQIQKALEQYYQDHQSYPPSSGSPLYEITDTSTTPSIIVPWGGTTPVWQKYIEVLPKDPDGSKQYQYKTDATGQMYWLYASLDRGAKDPDACPGGICSSNVQGLSCGTNITCNYGVSSPNTNP